MKVRLNGVVTSVETEIVCRHAYGNHEDPILPEGDWLEVTTVDSDMREYASPDRFLPQT